MSYISLSSSCALFRASYQSLIGRAARYTLSSYFRMLLLNSTQYDGNWFLTSTYRKYSMWTTATNACGRCSQRIFTEKSLPTVDTSRKDCPMSFFTGAHILYTVSKPPWQAGLCPCGTKHCSERDLSSSALTDWWRTRQTSRTQSAALYTTLQ